MGIKIVDFFDYTKICFHRVRPFLSYPILISRIIGLASYLVIVFFSFDVFERPFRLLKENQKMTKKEILKQHLKYPLPIFL